MRSAASALLVAGLHALAGARAYAAPAAAPAAVASSTGTLDAPVSVRVKDAPLSAYLDAVSAQAKLDFVLADGLERVRVTAFLTDATARDALEVLRLKGLTYRRVGKTSAYMITPRSTRAPRRETRIYTLSHAPLSDDDAAALKPAGGAAP